MELHKVHLQNPHKRIIQKAVDALLEGKVIIYPTDTVYGLGCDVTNKQAVEKIYKIKEKSKFAPMSIICNSIKQASMYAYISNFAFRILKRCFPGPYTVILEATKEIPKLMLSRRKEIGIRIPDSQVALALVENLGNAVLSTSVNMAENEFLVDLEEIKNKYNSKAEFFLDGGMLPEPIPSTVLKIVNEDIEIIREGKGSLQNIS
jgi:tRNA threonylcarbamoyl adenosine modification protein (Sua5/YciO/YrdC/YwlC family)